ncbi:class I adenylate-forming enzyme family protein [Nocardia sp. BMG51109]|uniref:class I adenylate-forming enzyme family protein n=1 Tax=Nocardia sp. BMG51109 TaxID=1056816 RepID=UPI000465E242|nr:class I adenylate-forming enzyme family protein [Nocardia sp. BMG51109]
MNIADFLHRPNRESIAISGADGTSTYGQLLDDVARLSTAYRAMKQTPGDRIGIVQSDTAAHILTYFSAVAGGYVAVSVNPKSTVAEMSRAFEATRPGVVVAEAAAVPRVRHALSRLSGPVELISDTPADGVASIPEILAATAPAGEAIVSMWSGDPASILFTSGSTGRPKGVVLTHGNVVWAARAKAARMRPTERDAVALIAPMHHAYGQNAVLNAAFSGGATVILLNPRRRGQLVADLAGYEVTALPSVPAVFRLLLDLGAGRDLLPRLRYALSAAAPLPRRTAETWLDRFGFPLHEGYGLTETSPCALYNDQRTCSPGSLGRPYEGVRTRIVDDAGHEVPDGDIGELLISGPNVMRGYFESPADTAERIVHGWLRTGDQVRRDEHGDHWFAGRKKNIIIVSGATVYPGEVESVLRDHPAVADAVVVGRPHPVVGETVTAVVQLRDSAAEAGVVSELRTLCDRRLAAYKRPASIRIAAIPLLASGKPDLERLRRHGPQ